jgi:predicted HAD superfamily phosphohydrolase YqeG
MKEIMIATDVQDSSGYYLHKEDTERAKKSLQTLNGHIPVRASLPSYNARILTAASPRITTSIMNSKSCALIGEKLKNKVVCKNLNRSSNVFVVPIEDERSLLGCRCNSKV